MEHQVAPEPVDGGQLEHGDGVERGEVPGLVLTTRMASVQTAPAEPAIRASIIGSAPKPLTALTPEMVSSTTPARAPRWRCRSEMASRTRREKRFDVTATTGRAAMATTPSSGLVMMRITPTAMARAALATQKGAEATTAWIWNRSLVTRDSSWPRLMFEW